jgi:hypothetical protein
VLAPEAEQPTPQHDAEDDHSVDTVTQDQRQRRGREQNQHDWFGELPQ